MSLHPEFASLILAGTKRVEFRKRKFGEAVTHVIVYATCPIKKILGFFEVSRVREDTPKKLWSKYRAKGGIARDTFWSYYGGRSTGVAIEVGRVYLLPQPLSLSAIGRSVIAPQSFRYISGRVVDKLARIILKEKAHGRTRLQR